MTTAESSASPTGKTITEHELEQCQRANQTGRQPVVFVHGLWLLPSSWDRWAKLFEDDGYVALTPGWPDDPETVEEAASKCQSGPERRNIPSGMCSRQKPIGRPTTRCRCRARRRRPRSNSAEKVGLLSTVVATPRPAGGYLRPSASQICALTPLCGPARQGGERHRPANTLVRVVNSDRRGIDAQSASLSGCVQVSADPKANDHRLCW
jgi:hypothetical protein